MPTPAAYSLYSEHLRLQRYEVLRQQHVTEAAERRLRLLVSAQHDGAILRLAGEYSWR